jgi:uncharacterized protein
MAEQFRVEIAPSHNVTAIIHRAAVQNRAGITLILGHGAGANQTSRFMVEFAAALAERGIDIVTFNFLYSEQRRRIPDPNGRLEACYQGVIATIRNEPSLSGGHLAIGGKSMGGRIASQVAAAGAGDLAGLVFLGYPLHPPGRPDRLRAKHLSDITAPMLFVQGSRDTFGTPEELRPIIRPLEPRADLYVVEGGDHSFKIPKRSPLTQEAAYEAVQDHVAAWLRAAVANRSRRN